MKKKSHKPARTSKARTGPSLTGVPQAALTGIAAILLLGSLIYSNSFSCSFHFDDLQNIVDNAAIRNLADVKGWWGSNPSRPVAMFTFALNYHFSQLDVRPWHAVNLIIHLSNACLAGWLTLLLFSAPTLRDKPIARHAQGIAFFTALLFVAHPLATQSVTYIVQRMTSLAAFFYFLSLLLYLKGRLTTGRSPYGLYAGAALSALLAMLTKQNAFTLPLAIVLVEIFFIRTPKLSLKLRDPRVFLGLGALLAALIAGSLFVSFSLFDPIPPSRGHTYTLNPANYLFTQFGVILKYIQLLALPIRQNLDYDFPISDSFFEPRTLLSFCALAALVASAFLLFPRHRLLSFGLFWFFVTLSIESSVIPIEDVIFEHRTYLPSFGFFIILTTLCYQFLGEKRKTAAVGLLAGMVCFFAVLTYQRNKIWADELTLWEDVVAKSPNIARPYFNRGIALAQAGRPEQAIADFTQALTLNPRYAQAYANRGITSFGLGQAREALADASRAIDIDPDYAIAYHNRGLAHDALGQFDKALEDYTRAIALDPYYRDAYSNRGITYGKLGQYQNSIDDFDRALAIDPNFQAARANRERSLNFLRQSQ